MNMEQMKRAMVSTFGNIRKRNRQLVCILMAGIMFATQTDLPRVFAEAGEEVNEAESAAGDTAAGDDADQAVGTVLITGFEELPAEVAKQTVAPGTPYEALVLPEELTAYVENKVDHSGENGEEDGAGENTGKEDGADDNSGEAGEGTEDNSGEAGDDAEDSDGAEGDTPEGSDCADGNDTNDNDSTDGDGAEEDSAGDNGNTDENATEDGSTEGEEPENSGAADGAETAAANADGDGNDSGVKQDNAEHSDGYTAESAQYEAHTTTVTLPAYQSENILTVETLEQSPRSAEDSPEATDTKTSEGIPEPSDESGQTAVVIPGITWESAPAYDSDIQGEYIFTPVVPEGYCVGEEVALPTIAVTVEQSAVKPRRALARAAAADGTHQDHTGWTGLRSNVTTLTSGNYYLTANMSNGVTIQSGATVNLCLNGYTLSSNSNVYDAVVTVESGATLNVHDCAGGGTIRFVYYSLPGIRTEGNVNVYGGTITGKGDGIHATGAAVVNLHGGIVHGEESSGIYLDSGTRLFMDGGEARNELTQGNSNPTAAVYMAQGSTAEITDGIVFAKSTQENIYQNHTMWILPDCRLTISGGTFDFEGERPGSIIMAVPLSDTIGGDARVEITGGTINCYCHSAIGELIINDTEIKKSITLAGGVLKIQGSQPIGTALPADEPDIIIRYARNVQQRLDAIELTGPLTNADGYTIRFSQGSLSSSYPVTVTRGFSTHMPGKQPSDCFTYLKETYPDNYDYKMVLSGGEVTLLPYVMTFDASGGTLAEDEKKGDITGAQYMRSLPVPTRDGYDFEGWYTEAAGGTEVTVDTMPHEDITVYAHWTLVTYDITYDLAGGTLPAGKTNPTAYQIESAAFTLHNPERTGYTFTGWSGTGLIGSANKDVTVAKGSMGERTYTANWKVNTYTVTLNGNGGSGTALTGYTYGTGATLPANWTRTGYTFAGWYDNEGLTGSAVTAIAADEVGNKTYYAKWTANAYTVTYHKNEGTITNETNYTSYTYGTGLTLPTPVKTGYAFGGWYETASFTGTKATSIGKSITGNKIYYAKWTANTYTVTYHKNEGTIANETNYTGYTYGTGLTLPTPVRTGYTFGGWYTSADFTGTPVTSIAANATGNKAYYAKWSPKQYTVTFSYQGATGGDGTASMQVTYDSAYGTLPQPEKDGYAFQGWYTQADGQGSQIVSTTKATADADHVLYAFWKDSEAPGAPALQSGVTVPADWTNAQSTVPLALTDNVGVTKLWVKVDDGGFMPAEGFAGSGASTQYTYKALEGNHTYAFKAADAAGNESGISVFTLKLDTAKPVIGPLSYENKAATLWQWIIGKKSMVIHVPVSDDGSGVTQIRYAMTPAGADGSYDDSREEEKTAAVVDGQAKVIFPQEEAYQGFRGRIVIACVDLAGNAADSVAVGMAEGMDGVLVEDTAPVITAMADRLPTDMTAAQPGGTAVSGDYYGTAPALMVTVTDDTGHQVAAGIASVTYQVGDAPAQSVAVGTDTMQGSIQFTVPASGIPAGVTAIRVTAQDHAGNESAETYTVRVKGPERKPAAVTDYRAEELTGFVPNAKYSINGVPYTADGQGCVPVAEAWMGTTLAVVKCGNGNETLDSAAQSLAIPARPQTPAPIAQDETGPNRKDGRLTGLTGNTAYEISTDGGRTWEGRTADADGAITGLAPGSYAARAAATDASFTSRVSEPPAVVKAYRISVLFMADGEAYTTLYTHYGESITQIPEVPAKKDAGEQLYEGAWCDAQGSPAVFTNIQADMTVYAVYTAFYTVTLQEGRGYTLTAAAGSPSPVKEGGSYGFTFALQKGYRKNAKFAVKVNGVAAESAEDGSYVIEGIRENKTVTVEGVVKKTSGSKPGNPGQPSGGDPSGDNGQPGGGDPSGDGGQPDGGNGSGDNGQPSGGDPSGGNGQPGGGNPSGGNGQPDGGNPSGDNGQPGAKKPPEDGAPMSGTKPSGTGTPPAGRTPSDQDGSDGTAPAGTGPGNPPEDDGGVTGTTPGSGEAQGTPPTDTEPAAGTEPQPDGEAVQTVSAIVDGGRIVLPDENTAESGGAVAGGNIATGNVGGMPGTSTVLKLNDGAVIVKVVCTEQDCSAGVEDTVAVANAVLTQTHMELVSNGEVIEIRIDVKDISSQVPEQDQEVIENGIAAYEGEIPGLKLGMYVDISMFIRTGQEDWQAVTETADPIAAVIGIPAGLQEDGREYYIIRAHEGEYTLMHDTDKSPDTITIKTDRFSSYAVAWQETGKVGGRCRLCHICPTFLGICCFVWLAVAVAAAFAVFVIMQRKRKSAE